MKKEIAFSFGLLGLMLLGLSSSVVSQEQKLLPSGNFYSYTGAV